MRQLLYIFLVTLTGCQTYYYYPSFQNVPTSIKSSEVKAEYFISAVDEPGINLSYSISNHLGTFLTLTSFDFYESKSNAHIADFGLYYYRYKYFDEYDINMTYSLSTAYGIGKDRRRPEFYDLDVKRIFLQPSFAISTKFIDFGLSGRFSQVNYDLHKIAGDQFDYSRFRFNDVGSKKFYFFEPNLYFGVGYKGFKLNMHLIKLAKLNDANILYYQELTGYFSLSIKQNIGDLFKKK